MSVIKDGVVCCDPDCWVICPLVFKECVNFIFMHSRSLKNSGCTYPACNMLIIMVFVSKRSSLNNSLSKFTILNSLNRWDGSVMYR